MGKMTITSNADWLRLIRSAAARSSRMRLTRHARRRMLQRKVVIREVMDTVQRGRLYEPPAPAISPPGHWTVRLVGRGGVVVVLGLDPADTDVILHVITVMRER